MLERLSALFRKPTEKCVEEWGRDAADSEGDRVAYRIAYEAALAWTASEYATLEAYRNRAAVFLSAAVVAVGAGIGASDAVPGQAIEHGCLTTVGLLVASVGFAGCLLGASRLMCPLKGPFVLEPQTLVEEYGDNPADYPTEDETYRNLALWGSRRCNELSASVRDRCRWIYVSMGGLPLAVSGVVLIWADGL